VTKPSPTPLASPALSLALPALPASEPLLGRQPAELKRLARRLGIRGEPHYTVALLPPEAVALDELDDGDGNGDREGEPAPLAYLEQIGKPMAHAWPYPGGAEADDWEKAFLDQHARIAAEKIYPVWLLDAARGWVAVLYERARVVGSPVYAECFFARGEPPRTAVRGLDDPCATPVDGSRALRLERWLQLRGHGAVTLPQGRPALEAEEPRGGDWRAVLAQAEKLKASHPYWTWEIIARKVGVEPRTLRKYRLRRADSSTG
jgi:hypothetical protein